MNNNRWVKLRQSYRQGVMRVLKDIEDGSIKEEDLVKLRNFCAIALVVQSKVTEHVWKHCTREAEIAAMLHGQAIDMEDEDENSTNL